MVEHTSNGGKTDHFFYYNAAKHNMAVHKDRPWQICTKMGVLIGYKATAEECEKAVIALQTDKNAGTLPCDLSKWEKHDEFLK